MIGAAKRLTRASASRTPATSLLASMILMVVLATGVSPSAARATASPAPTAVQTVPATGQDVPALAEFERTMQALIARWQLPGGQLAVAKDGRLVLNRGYGLADVERGEPVEPTALFRIASVTKVLTVVATLRLVDDGLLRLDDRPFRLLDRLAPPAHAAVDPRLDDVTIQNLLQHAGGWNSTEVDPQAAPWTWQAAGVLGVPAPPTAEQIVRYMIGQPLDLDPGTRAVYSNFGYNVLGRVIERVSGMAYGDYVQARVLAPAGIRDMRIGRTLLEERAPGEVRYYAAPGEPQRPSVFPGVGYVPPAYGAFYLESFDAHGGWLASAADLVRFATAVDGQRPPALLRRETVDAMLRTPLPRTPDVGGTGAGNEQAASGLGWIVQPAGSGLDWSHAGALVGSSTAWLIRTADGVAMAFVFNSQPEDAAAFFQDAIGTLTTTAGAVTAWPAHDLFAVR